MENTKKILLDNLTGKDIEEIGNRMDCSSSKIIKCLKGSYTGNKDLINEVLIKAREYFVERYTKFLYEIEKDTQLDKLTEK